MNLPDVRRAAALLLAVCIAPAFQPKTLRVLFIGNSFTGRHNLSDIVKQMAEAGNPGLRFEVTTVIYGGRRLVDHWRLGTQNVVKLATLSPAEEKATIAGSKPCPRRTPSARM